MRVRTQLRQLGFTAFSAFVTAICVEHGDPTFAALNALSMCICIIFSICEQNVDISRIEEEWSEIGARLAIRTLEKHLKDQTKQAILNDIKEAENADA